MSQGARLSLSKRNGQEISRWQQHDLGGIQTDGISFKRAEVSAGGQRGARRIPTQFIGPVIGGV